MSQSDTRKLVILLASFLSITVGVGIFALPYTYQQQPLLGFTILLMTSLVYCILYTFYIDIILEKGIGIHQLPGIALKIWGKPAKHIAGTTLVIGRIGSLFLYMFILGQFGTVILHNVSLPTPSPILISLVATIPAVIAIAKKAHLKATLDIILSSTKIALIGLISIAGILYLMITDPSRFSGIITIPSFNFLTRCDTFISMGQMYGVSAAALSGIAAIPSLKETSQDRHLLYRSTRIGTIIAVVLYALFAFFIMSRSSPVSEDALSGLAASGWVTALAFAGFISVLTAYIGVGYSLFEVFSVDYSLPKWFSLLLTIGLPIIPLLAGIHRFAPIAALVGGTIGAAEGLTILGGYWHIKRENRELSLGIRILTIAIATLLLLGFILIL